MRKYLKRLKAHPGVPVATGFTLFGALARASEAGIEGLFVGALMASVIVWPIVLWTARSQPISGGE